MINCIAVDDESLALELLEDNIKRVPFLNLAAKCKTAFEAMEVLQREKIDLIFLDIQMPGLTGIQFLKTLHSRPMVIFTTAYSNYALQGYELDVVDYLVKPIEYERFLKAVNKAFELSSLRTQASNQEGPEMDFIFVNVEYSMMKVYTNEITHIEGLKDYIKIFTTSSTRAIITRLSMKLLEESLPKNRFIRVHKSFIVNIEKIQSIRRGRISLGEKVLIPLSDFYKDNFQKLIDSKSFQ